MAVRQRTGAKLSLKELDHDALVALRAKYLDLSRKYAALVERLERRTEQTTAVFRLGFWALKATASGLALVVGGTITMTNSRWARLNAPGPPWEADGEPARRSYPDLRELALGEAARLPARGAARALRRFRRLDGEEQVLEVRLERLSATGAPVAVFAQDITAVVRTEREAMRMREALFQKEHLSILGELASAVAHDLGNTLRGLSARVTLLAQDPEVARRQEALVAGLQESVEAALVSVRRLHDLARSGPLQPGPVDLNAILRDSIESLRLRQPPGAPGVEISAKVPELPPVLGTVPELSHLFVSLLLNARDAMPEGGKVHIQAERSDGAVVVTVTDEGHGIEPENMPHLFQPFFTTKGPAGTGLGLWLAQSTMRRVGGSISARNGKRRGAEFRIELPLAAGAGEDLKQDRAAAPRRGSPARTRG